MVLDNRNTSVNAAEVHNSLSKSQVFVGNYLLNFTHVSNKMCLNVLSVNHINCRNRAVCWTEVSIDLSEVFLPHWQPWKKIPSQVCPSSFR